MLKKLLSCGFALLMILSVAGCKGEKKKETVKIEASQGAYTLDNLPDYDGVPFVALYDNEPQFEKKELRKKSFESYSPLDSLGRCGEALASVGKDIMPTEDRGSIGQVKPSGWVTAKYDFVDGKYLYNRCHLIGFQLTGENANERNLITGTRYMNVEGMLPFENMIADYVKETDNHVMYRVTPIFEGKNLVASGVHMEARSVEDDGEGISFNVYVYNVQPNVEINYLNGESREKGSEAAENTADKGEYVLNESSKKFHKSDCSSVETIKAENRRDYNGSRQKLIDSGFKPCGACKP